MKAVCDDTMHDRWIPDEDWVCQIQDTGNDDCTTNNLNHGLSQQCLWQNDRAILEGTTIFYNKKQVQTLKTKTMYKNFRFYYVLTAGKPAPNISSDKAFYQSLWDDPDSSNRLLKRTAAPQAKTTVSPLN
jgi:hypothetical protein